MAVRPVILLIAAALLGCSARPNIATQPTVARFETPYFSLDLLSDYEVTGGEGPASTSDDFAVWEIVHNGSKIGGVYIGDHPRRVEFTEAGGATVRRVETPGLSCVSAWMEGKLCGREILITRDARQEAWRHAGIPAPPAWPMYVQAWMYARDVELTSSDEQVLMSLSVPVHGDRSSDAPQK